MFHYISWLLLQDKFLKGGGVQSWLDTYCQVGSWKYWIHLHFYQKEIKILFKIGKKLNTLLIQVQLCGGLGKCTQYWQEYNWVQEFWEQSDSNFQSVCPLARKFYFKESVLPKYSYMTVFTTSVVVMAWKGKINIH